MKSRGSSGFTLIELMVVVIVLAALAGMLIPNLVDKPDKMKKEIVLADLRAIDTCVRSIPVLSFTESKTANIPRRSALSKQSLITA